MKVPLGYVPFDDSEDEDYEYSGDDDTEDDVSLVDEDETKVKIITLYITKMNYKKKKNV